VKDSVTLIYIQLKGASCNMD